MNGNIVRVLVVGNRFQTGVTLLLLNAMKIEQSIKASNFGAVIEMFYLEPGLVHGVSQLLSVTDE